MKKSNNMLLASMMLLAAAAVNDNPLFGSPTQSYTGSIKSNTCGDCSFAGKSFCKMKNHHISKRTAACEKYEKGGSKQ